MPAEIEPSEVQELLEAGGGPDLLDCREPAELEICGIEGALHIPMGEVPQRLDELDREKQIVVFCHKGARSAQVAMFLEGQGFAHVKSMAGGIHQWSMEVDPDVAMY